jgi:hypothetical protein
MPVTEKTYPEWVQKHRTRGTTVKKKGDSYYLYKRTSKRVPGKKYPQPVDTFIGVITPEGVIASDKRKISLSDIEVYEYGFSKALWELCPKGWKKPLGDDWEDVLKIILKSWSPESYLLRGENDLSEEQFHYQFPAQMASLSRRIYKTHDVNIKDLECLKRIYLVKMDKQEALSKMNEDQKALIAKLGVQMEVG